MVFAIDSNVKRIKVLHVMMEGAAKELIVRSVIDNSSTESCTSEYVLFCARNLHACDQN